MKAFMGYGHAWRLLLCGSDESRLFSVSLWVWPVQRCFSVCIQIFITIRIKYQPMSKTDHPLLSLKYLVASFVATYCSGVVHPLDLIKTRFQSHDGKSVDNIVPRYSGIKNALSVIYKDEGLKGLYKGFYISLLCQASSMAFFFWIYESRKEQLQAEGKAKLQAVVLASTEASLAATLLTQPVWVVKTRMLLNVDPRISEYQNCRKAIREIHAQHGWKGFLKGLQLSLVLSFTGVVQMYTYQGAKTVYEKMAIPESSLAEKHFLCGAVSKLFSAAASYPITTLRTRIQQNQFASGCREGKYGGVMDLAIRTMREQGIRGFYKGMTANLMKGVSQKGIYFSLYEILKEKFFTGKPLTQ